MRLPTAREHAAVQQQFAGLTVCRQREEGDFIYSVLK